MNERSRLRSRFLLPAMVLIVIMVLPAAPVGAAPSTGDVLLLESLGRDGGFFTVETAGGDPTRVLMRTAERTWSSARWSPDGRHIAGSFTAYDEPGAGPSGFGYAVVRPDGSGLSTVYSHPAFCGHTAGEWLPDGVHLVARITCYEDSGGRYSELILIDTDSGRSTTVTDSDRGLLMESIIEVVGPRGEAVILSVGTTRGVQLQRVDLDDGTITDLGDHRVAAVSPDLELLVTTDLQADATDLMPAVEAVLRDARSLEVLTTLSQPCWPCAGQIFPTWSPDGRSVAVHSIGSSSSIEVFTPHGEPQASIDSVPGGQVLINELAWAPDGRRLAFITDANQIPGHHNGLHVWSPGLSEPEQLLSWSFLSLTSAVTWSPSGTELAYTPASATGGIATINISTSERQAVVERMDVGWVQYAPRTAPRFWDVSPSSVHAAAIDELAERGIAEGLGDGSFRPGHVVQRGQMATFIARSLGITGTDPPQFPDAHDSVHAAAIAAVSEAGIASGFADGTFRPSEAVTRGQMASFLARAANLSPATHGSFSDVAGSVHADSIDAVAQVGITTGFADGTFRPDDPVSREQMATFLIRLLATTETN